jgi:hypothetical protein
VKAFGKTPHLRLRDDAGNYIREQAYPILSRLEQGLRTFINRALVERVRFDWSETALQARLPENPVSDPQFPLHALETLQFDDLISFVTSEVSLWSPDHPLTVADMLELLADVDSIEELRAQFMGRTEKISLWDDIFSDYFEDRDEWQKIKEQFDFVLRVRHKVMHHRPVQSWELDKLRTIEQELSTLLDSAAEELGAEHTLTPEQLEAMNRLFSQAIEHSRFTMANALESVLGTQHIMASESLSKAIEETMGISEILEQHGNTLADAIQPMLGTQHIMASESLSKAIEETMGISKILEQHGNTLADAIQPMLDTQHIMASESLRRSLQETMGISEIMEQHRNTLADAIQPMLDSHHESLRAVRNIDQMMANLPTVDFNDLALPDAGDDDVDGEGTEDDDNPSEPDNDPSDEDAQG